MRMIRSMKYPVLLAVLLSALVISPAGAASTKSQDQTWVGQIERHGGHFDYVGRPCPVGTGMLCANYVAHYRIVPVNAAARAALAGVAGKQAELLGRLHPTQNDPQHQGRLLVRRVRPVNPTPPPGRVVTADESNNGSSVTLAPGDHLRVVLHSTYWQFNPSSNPSVLAADGGPQVGPGTNCPRFPGSGCGTVTQQYTALHGGKAVVSADRSSCGEALQCRPDQSHYQLNVKVTG